jgi:hypothetical protein
MQNMQNVKTVGITPPAAIIDNAAATTATVDTKGFSKGPLHGLSRSTGHRDDGVQAPAFRRLGNERCGRYLRCRFQRFAADLAVASDDNHFFAIYVDLRGKKRYMDLSLTLGDGAAGSFITAWVDLYGAAETPDTAAERGLTQQAIV